MKSYPSQKWMLVLLSAALMVGCGDDGKSKNPKNQPKGSADAPGSVTPSGSPTASTLECQMNEPLKVKSDPRYRGKPIVYTNLKWQKPLQFPDGSTGMGDQLQFFESKWRLTPGGNPMPTNYLGAAVVKGDQRVGFSEEYVGNFKFGSDYSEENGISETTVYVHPSDDAEARTILMLFQDSDLRILGVKLTYQLSGKTYSGCLESAQLVE